MFLGYAEGSKAYKLWDGGLQKFVISRDVTFDKSTNFFESKYYIYSISNIHMRETEQYYLNIVM